MRSRGKGVAGIFIPRRKRAERDFLKIAREQSLEESENKEKIQISKERIRWKEDFLYTELCFYVQKVLFFYGFREYFHKQNDRCFTILWKFDEKSARELLYISEKRLERNKNDERSVK